MEQSASSTLQIEENKTAIRELQELSKKLEESNSKLQEPVSKYIQTAETIQISKLTIDKLENDGFTLITRTVSSINDSDYQLPE
ncbi:hypothetical protein BC833DRAFT_604132 [Globomyces pollinis-pini]|nr:hypothetical protein BC833DRAFT_604132 [Globomyces pollinis-pini]